MDDETLVSLGGELKSLGLNEDGKERVGGYLVVFGDASNTDQQGDWFTPNTYFGANQGNGADAMIHHGFPLKRGVPELAWTQNKLLPPLKTYRDEVGIFAETVCDLSDKHEAKIAELVKRGKLRWSSGSSDSHVRRRGGGVKGEITFWPIVEGSLTPTPCQAVGTGVAALKSFAEDDLDEEVEGELKFSKDQPRDDGGKWTIVAGSSHRIQGRAVSRDEVAATAKKHGVSDKGVELLQKAHDEGKVKTDDHLLRAIAHGIHHADGDPANASHIAEGIAKHGAGSTHEGKFGGWEGHKPTSQPMQDAAQLQRPAALDAVKHPAVARTAQVNEVARKLRLDSHNTELLHDVVKDSPNLHGRIAEIGDVAHAAALADGSSSVRGRHVMEALNYVDNKNGFEGHQNFINDRHADEVEQDRADGIVRLNADPEVERLKKIASLRGREPKFVSNPNYVPAPHPFAGFARGLGYRKSVDIEEPEFVLAPEEAMASGATAAKSGGDEPSVESAHNPIEIGRYVKSRLALSGVQI